RGPSPVQPSHRHSQQRPSLSDQRSLNSDQTDVRAGTAIAEPHAPTQRPHADRPTRPDRHPVPATFDREIVTSDTHVSREFGGDAHSAHTHVATAPSPIRSTPTPSARRTASASDTANTVNTASVSGCSTCTC